MITKCYQQRIVVLNWRRRGVGAAKGLYNNSNNCLGRRYYHDNSSRKLSSIRPLLRRHNNENDIDVASSSSSSSSSSLNDLIVSKKCKQQQPEYYDEITIIDNNSTPQGDTVKTIEKRLVPILSSSSSPSSSGTTRIPLTVTDFHLRHEQLPFAYFFDEHLDVEDLISSLQRVLVHYPILGGTIDLSSNGGGGVYIQSQPGHDTIPVSIGQTNLPLSYWLGKKQKNENNESDDGIDDNFDVMGHNHKSGIGHPQLLPLFDPLFEPSSSSSISSTSATTTTTTAAARTTFENLISIRITYCIGSDGRDGTIIGVNMNHVLGDAASCIRFVQCWGREMRYKSYPTLFSNDRSSATCSGMMSPELLDLMGVVVSDTTNDSNSNSNIHSANSIQIIQNMIPNFVTDYCSKTYQSFWNHYFKAENVNNSNNKREEDEDKACNFVDHEYVHLYFSPSTLVAMKALGMEQCSSSSSLDNNHNHNQQQQQYAPITKKGNHNNDDGIMWKLNNSITTTTTAAAAAAAANYSTTSTSKSTNSFVSTNDMITACGWIMKRQLSGHLDYNLSMVINLRGRFTNVHDFTDIYGSNTNNNNSNSNQKGGVFGNGITNVIATLPQSNSSSSAATSVIDEESSIDDNKINFIIEICKAAISIRDALTIGSIEIPDRIASSRMGRVLSSSSSTTITNSSGIFSTTSWGKFSSSLWKIRFQEQEQKQKQQQQQIGNNIGNTCGQLIGFHAHPSYPLPIGKTYSSVIVPAQNGGFVYKLLLPSNQAIQAKRLHQQICTSFVNWYNNNNNNNNNNENKMKQQLKKLQTKK